MKDLKMKGIGALVLFATLATVPAVWAGGELRRTPVTQFGNALNNANLAGCKYAVSTGATTSVVIASGKGLLYSIDTSSSAGSTGVDTWVVLRDSATSNTAQSTWLIPPVVFGGIGGTHLSWTTPIRFTSGLQWQVNLATSTVTVGYTLDSDK